MTSRTPRPMSRLPRTLFAVWVLVPLLSVTAAPVPAAHAQFAPAVLYAAGDGPTSVAIGDLDGDQAPDLAVANWFSDNVSVLLNQSPWPCYPDCDPNGVLDIFDFLCFQNSFVNGEPYACDCDTSTGPLVCDLFDFLCFQGAFVGGCP